MSSALSRTDARPDARSARRELRSADGPAAPPATATSAGPLHPAGSRDVGTTSVVVAGVSGVGKTTVGRLLAARTGWAFVEGDDLHPAANVAKMRAGRPLDDADRAPWLRALARVVGEQEQAGRDVVVTCSALRAENRRSLAAGHPSVWFALLDAPPQLLEDRLAGRTGHFMPAALLASQLAALEPLHPDEPGLALDAIRPPEDVVAEMLAALRARGRRR